MYLAFNEYLTNQHSVSDWCIDYVVKKILPKFGCLTIIPLLFNLLQFHPKWFHGPKNPPKWGKITYSPTDVPTTTCTGILSSTRWLQDLKWVILMQNYKFEGWMKLQLHWMFGCGFLLSPPSAQFLRCSKTSCCCLVLTDMLFQSTQCFQNPLLSTIHNNNNLFTKN